MAATRIQYRRALVCAIISCIVLLAVPLSCFAFGIEIFPTTKRVFQSTPVKEWKDNQKIDLWAARNEYESAQIAVRSNSMATISRIECTDLVMEGTGRRIAKRHFQVRLVKYVRVNQNTKNTPPAELDGAAPNWFADPIDELAMPLSFNNTRSIWVTWYVGTDTTPGQYNGSLTLNTSEGIFRIPVTVHVWRFKVPERPSLFVTNWLHISQVESQYKVKRGSPEFWGIIDRIALDMISHRQNVIFTPLSLIRSTRHPNGRYTFDFKEYEKWVRIFMKRGFQVIEGSHLFHPGNSYSLYHDVNGSMVEMKITKGQLSTREHKEFLTALLDALHRENTRLRIQDKYVQHVCDEPKQEDLALYKELAAIVRRSMPGAPIMDAIEFPPEKMKGMADIPVTLLGRPLSTVSSPVSVKWGKWWYTAVVPTGRYPNRFIDFPVAKMRVIPWLSWCNGVNGYLHYAYNWWFAPSGKSPWEDTDQSGTYPPGDGFVVYPPLNKKMGAPVSSLRWEAFRDGMEDYEYLVLVKQWKDRQEAERKKGTLNSLESASLDEATRLLNEVYSAMTGTENYLRDPAAVSAMRYRIGSFLHRVSR